MTIKKRATDTTETAPPDAAEAAAKAPTVEHWRGAKKTPAWAFAAAKMMHGWPIGLVLDEKAYDDAVDAAAHVPISGTPTTPTRRRRKVS